MTNRTEMIAAEINENLDDVLKKFLSSKHSRLPVYRNNIDNIEGFIYIKDLLPFYIKKQSQDITPKKIFKLVKS